MFKEMMAEKKMKDNWRKRERKMDEGVRKE